MLLSIAPSSLPSLSFSICNDEDEIDLLKEAESKEMVAPGGFEPPSVRHFISEGISMIPKPTMLDRYTTGLLLGEPKRYSALQDVGWDAILPPF